MRKSHRRLQHAMRPGQLSGGGFLGKKEKLRHVLRADEITLARLGVTTGQLADALERVLLAAREATRGVSGIPECVVGTHRVRLRVTRGFQTCPWECPELDGPIWFNSLDFRIENTASGAEISGPGMIVHLIREHGFFEGHGSRYRVDPEMLARVLDLL